MFTFTEEHVQPILDGRKTQTRRLREKAGAVVGRSYQCRCGRFTSDEPFAYVRVTAMWQERLLQISYRNALAEGYPTAELFLAAFWRSNGTAALTKHGHNPLVWAFRFELVTREEYEAEWGVAPVPGYVPVGKALEERTEAAPASTEGSAG